MSSWSDITGDLLFLRLLDDFLATFILTILYPSTSSYLSSSSLHIKNQNLPSDELDRDADDSEDSSDEEEEASFFFFFLD